VTLAPIGPGRRQTFMAAAAAVLAASGVLVITLAMQGADEHAPQPPAEAFGYVEPWRPVVASGQTVKTDDGVSRTAAQPVDDDPNEVPSSLPTEIAIPSIGTHSTLQYVGLTPSGALEVPRSPRYHEAAWYKYSSEPGSPGPAVILGHVDSVEDGKSIFFYLGDVRPGDEIQVTRSDGLIAVFVVDGVRSYPKTHFPSFLVYGATERSTLRVITCGGRWNSSLHSFEENIVVFASLTEFRETPRRAIIS
jgi:hypothetical protein